jgi:imidazoleglycerol phosphate synthase glutamine amidotransferase subunit HisH
MFGLDLIKGEVISFVLTPDYRVPHIVWNKIYYDVDIPDYMKGIEMVTSFYFVHSYYCQLLESIPSVFVDYFDRNLFIGFKK